MLIYNDFVSLFGVLLASFLHRDSVETHGALRMLGESGWIETRGRHQDQCIGGSFCAKSTKALLNANTKSAPTQIRIARLVQVNPISLATRLGKRGIKLFRQTLDGHQAKNREL